MNQKEAFLNIESYSEYVKHRDEFKGLKIDREVLGHVAKIFPKGSGTKEELLRILKTGVGEYRLGVD